MMEHRNLIRVSGWRHPEQSRFSGAARDLARVRSTRGPREFPRTAGKNAVLRDDAKCRVEAQ